MDDFEKCLRDYCESAVIGAGANDIGFFKDGARWAQEYIESQRGLTNIFAEQDKLRTENQRLREALALFMSCRNMKGAHLRIGLQMAHEAAKQALETEGKGAE